MRVLAVAVAVVLAGVALGYVEEGCDDPRTADPPIARPPTRACTVRLFTDAAFTDYGYKTTQYVARREAECAGPWAAVILDWDGAVKGRQYDRWGMLWVGNVEILRTTTPEPCTGGIHWHVEKDVSEYAVLFQRDQPVVAQVPNVVTDVYTGIFYINVNLTFYAAVPPAHGARRVPDAVIGVSANTTPPVATEVVTQVVVPARTVRAVLDVYAAGHSCEEFWYTNVPNEYIREHPDEGLCGQGAYRELQVLIDGVVAGVALPFPTIYTGGVNPLLWRPITGISSFNVPPYRFDITQFLPNLTDGRPHEFHLRVVPNSGVWFIDGALFLRYDPDPAHITSGKIVRYRASPTSNITVARMDDLETNTTVFTTTGRRFMSLESYINTSTGRVRTSVRHVVDAINVNTIVMHADGGAEQLSEGNETTVSSTVLVDALGTRMERRVRNFFPYSIRSYFWLGEPGGHDVWTIVGNVTYARNRLDTWRIDRGPEHSRHVVDSITGDAVLTRDDTNKTTVAADGQTHERFLLRRDGVTCYDHVLQANHGRITRDVTRTGLCS